MKFSGHGFSTGLTIILVFKFLFPTAEVVPDTDNIPISLRGSCTMLPFP